MLKRNLERARERGLHVLRRARHGVLLLRGRPTRREPPQPLDTSSYFDLTTADVAGDIRKETIHTLEALGIPVEYSHHEDAPSQHEIDLRYTDALTMADNVMTFRLVVKEVAHEHGVHATFMPKPMERVQGSGMHTHFSLFEGDTNAFHDPGDPYGLSKIGRGFIAGLLRHAREISAVTNQWVNSYKRLVVGFEAPVYISWARNNRSVVVQRARTRRRARPSRRASSTALPIRRAIRTSRSRSSSPPGCEGIEESYDLPPETTANLYQLTEEERLAEGIEMLPGSLSDALDVMDDSELVAEALGEHVFEWFIRNKRAEWREYKTHISQFELDRYYRNL